jgi:hypothetical protein
VLCALRFAIASVRVCEPVGKRLVAAKTELPHSALTPPSAALPGVDGFTLGFTGLGKLLRSEVAALAPNCGCGVDQKSKHRKSEKSESRESFGHWRTKDEFEDTNAAESFISDGRWINCIIF